VLVIVRIYMLDFISKCGLAYVMFS
jgi:hypothetical protein